MANEISLNLNLSYNRAGLTSSAIGMSFIGSLSPTAYGVIRNTLLVGITATLIPMGGIATPGFFFGINNDPTNYITLFNGLTGAVFLRLQAGYPSCCPLDPTGTYYALANTSACEMEYEVCAA